MWKFVYSLTGVEWLFCRIIRSLPPSLSLLSSGLVFLSASFFVFLLETWVSIKLYRLSCQFGNLLHSQLFCVFVFFFTLPCYVTLILGVVCLSVVFCSTFFYSDMDMLLRLFASVPLNLWTNDLDFHLHLYDLVRHLDALLCTNCNISCYWYRHSGC